MPPLALVILTRLGIPVSTSLLVLTAFKGLVAHQQGKDPKSAIDLFESMMKKSLVGYAIAFVLGLVIFYLVLHNQKGAARSYPAQPDGQRQDHHHLKSSPKSR